MASIPLNPSESTKRRNPSLYPIAEIKSAIAATQPAVDAMKRIRQSSKPLMNKLESEWHEVLKTRYPNSRIRPQGIRLRIANGVTYTPDFFCIGVRTQSDDELQPTCWETKGKHSWDDSVVKLKVAASEWPEIRFILVWKVDGQWREQVILQ